MAKPADKNSKAKAKEPVYTGKPGEPTPIRLKGKYRPR